MILTPSDIERIRKLGYRINEFAFFDGKYWRLKNVDGRCFFLNSNGLCSIYENRPLGCRAYPIIFVDNKCVPDFEICPYAVYISDDEIYKGCVILKEIFEELGESLETE